MKTIKVSIISNQAHNSQILTGFYLLNNNHEYIVDIIDERDNNPTYNNLAFVLAEYDGKKLIYDTLDGFRKTPDIYENLHTYEMLISDSSSIVYDYILIDRPMIFLCPDLEEYMKEVIRQAGKGYVVMEDGKVEGSASNEIIDAWRNLETQAADETRENTGMNADAAVAK